MSDPRQVNREWKLLDDRGQFCQSIADGITLAVLIDIRRELQAIHRRLDCAETIQIPATLRQIRDNTTKRKYERKPKP